MPMSATTKIKNMCARINGYFTRSTPMPISSLCLNKIYLTRRLKTVRHGLIVYLKHI